MTYRTKLLMMVTFTSACASAGPSAERREESAASIRAAEEVGATAVPQAALHLQLAKEEFEQAKALTQQGNGERATGLLMRSQADADLALALARSESEKNEAQQAVSRVRSLQPATP